MIKDLKIWRECEEKNQDPYSKCCVDVARQVMKILDEEYEGKKQIQHKDTHTIVCRADKEINAGSITGFMAGCVSQMVSICHSLGEEWRKAWNIDNQIGNEGKKANEGDGVLNPALLNIGG